MTLPYGARNFFLFDRPALFLPGKLQLSLTMLWLIGEETFLKECS